jgi:hypothetical protein
MYEVSIKLTKTDDAMSGRITHPVEVADLIVPLANECAGNVIGSGFIIDGGLTTALRTQGSAN